MVTSIEGCTSSGSTPEPANFTETTALGHRAQAVALLSQQAAAYPTGVPVDNGSTPQTLDTSAGLVSALGGQDVHALAA